MASADWHYLELLEVGKLVHSGEVSPVEVTEAQLDRIGRLDGELKSFAHVMADSAMAEARAAEKEIAAGTVRSALHGVPIAVKDLCWTHDAPTGAGMTIYKDFRPTEDGTVVKKLREAGAIILGKLQLTEGAYADHHPDIPAPQNPWSAEHWSGASSSGSGAATAAGLCYGSLGSDTGGSIRFPSAANGVTGLKPTWGRVSRYGVFELAATLDHIGPMARSAADTGAMLNVLAGEDPNDPTTSLEPVGDYLAGLDAGLKGLVIGYDPVWSTTGIDEVTAATLARTIETIRSLGGDIREVSFPDTEQMVADWFVLCGIECAVAHEATYPSRKAEYGPSLAALIELGRAQSALDYQKIVLRRHDFRGRVARVFADVDVLVVPAQAVASPTMARMAKLGEDEQLVSDLLRYTCPFDMTGSPALTLPAGFTAENTPVAFQFVGRHFDEARIVQAGHAFQQATDWHRRHPQL